MRPIEEVRNYLETELYDKLTQLEKRRLRIVFYIKKGLIFGVPAFIISLFFVHPFVPVTTVFLLGAGLRQLILAYKREYKNDVIAPMLAFIVPQLNYEPDKYIARVRFTESGLGELPDKVSYSGNDYISGKIGDNFIEYCELKLGTSGKSDDRSSTFFIAEFNKNFNGRTLVCSDLSKVIAGRFGDALRTAFAQKRGELVKLESPDFDKRFAVYSTDQIEARYILTPLLQEKLVSLSKLHEGYRVFPEIHISFLNNKVYVLIAHKPIFDPGIFESIKNFDNIKRYYDDIGLAFFIVESLNLNVNIWKA